MTSRLTILSEALSAIDRNDSASLRDPRFIKQVARALPRAQSHDITARTVTLLHCWLTGPFPEPHPNTVRQIRQVVS